MSKATSHATVTDNYRTDNLRLQLLQKRLGDRLKPFTSKGFYTLLEQVRKDAQEERGSITQFRDLEEHISRVHEEAIKTTSLIAAKMESMRLGEALATSKARFIKKCWISYSMAESSWPYQLTPNLQLNTLPTSEQYIKCSGQTWRYMPRKNCGPGK